MDIFDKIIEALELERELGTRTVEIDRALLVAPAKKNPPAEAKQSVVVARVPEAEKAARPAEAPAAVMTPTRPAEIPEPPAVPAAADAPRSGMRDFAFFTGRPLSPPGDILFGKMLAAMGYTREKVYVNEDKPSRIIVLMGAEAHRARAPQVKAVRGKWFEIGGVPAVTTFSPDFILSHFSEGSGEMRSAKQEVWEVLKSALGRLRPADRS